MLGVVYAECGDFETDMPCVIMLNVVMQSVFMFNVIMLNVVAHSLCVY
jgi:hypothetical protein